ELVSLPCCSCVCLAAARSFSNDLDLSSPNRDADLCSINGVVNAGLGLAPPAARANSPSVPSLVAKDAVCLRNGMPTLNVAQGVPVGVPGPDVSWIEFGLEHAHLGVGERHHFVLTISTSLGLLSSTPGIAPPRLRSPSRPWRSSLGGCVSQ